MSSSENLTKLKRIRGGHRGSFKKIIAELEAELTTSLLELDLVQIEKLKHVLQEKTTTLKKLDSDILDLLEDEEEILEDIEVADEYKGIAYAAIIKAEKYTTGAPIKQSVSDSTAPTVPSGVLVTPTVSDDVNPFTTLPADRSDTPTASTSTTDPSSTIIVPTRSQDLGIAVGVSE